MVGYTRLFKKEGIKIKLTLYFSEVRLKILDKLRLKSNISRASQVENLVNKELDRCQTKKAT